MSEEKIAKEDLSGKGAEISYSSSNENAVSIDDKGKLTFNGFGRADIKASVLYKDYIGEAEMVARTTVDGLYIATPVFYNSSKEINKLKDTDSVLKVTAEYMNTNTESKIVYLVFALYENDVLKTYTKKPHELKVGEDTLTMNISDFSYSEGMKAELFIWGDENIPKLVTETVVIQ